MKIKGSLTLDASGLSRTNGGFLVGDAKVARAGNVQNYFGHEIGLTGDDADKMFGVYRDPDVVFDEASMMSLAGRPVTRGHPADGVDATTWKDLAVGSMGGKIVRDGEHVVASMAIMDATAAAEVEAGARSLSAGYTVGIQKDDGVSPDGTPYQYRQVGPLRFNHVAYLPDNNPRAGNTRIGDDARTWGVVPPITPSSKKEDNMSDALKTVVLGDEAAQVAVADATKVEKFKENKAKEIADLKADHKSEIDKKDEEIGTLKADLKKAQDAAMTPEKLRDAAKSRAALEATAKAVDANIDRNLDDGDLRKAIVASKLGDEAVKDVSDAEISGMYRVIASDTADGGATDPLKQPIRQRTADAGADPWAKFETKKEA